MTEEKEKKKKIFKENSGRTPKPDEEVSHSSIKRRKMRERQEIEKAQAVSVQNKNPQELFPPTPERIFDRKVFEALCEAHCSPYEIERIMRLTKDDLQVMCMLEYKESFTSLWDRYKCSTLATLRRNQFRLAESSASMAIWLGKVYLGQKDLAEAEGHAVVGKLLIDVIKKMKD